MKRIIAVLFFLILFSVSIWAQSSYSESEGILFGGYCYYIENGDIYRAPITELSGETELFRKDSVSIMLDGSALVSKKANGDTVIYSLISEDLNSLDRYLSVPENDDMLLGSLSARYESNGDPAAISSGNDAGGVSFGAYQFASKAGVPKAFSEWCISSGRAADIGNRLLEAYSSDNNACGEHFKEEWLAIAEEDSDRFLLIQHEYVKEKYYDAIVSRVEKNVKNFDIDMYGIALKNVFWSRSVQHGVGGSYNVITRAFEAIGGFALQAEEILIKAIYAESGAVVDSGTYPMTGTTAESLGIAGKYMKYYSRNSSAVQVSVYRRLNINELGQALEMLEKYGGYTPSDDLPYELGNIYAANVRSNSAELFGTIYNYRLANITEYGFFIGKTMNSLIDMPVSKSVTTAPVVSFSRATVDSSFIIEPSTKYYFGIYAFIDSEYITSDIFTFTSEKPPICTATFLNFDGSLLQRTEVLCGSTPIYSGAQPTKPSNAQYTYTFYGWDKLLTPIENDTVFTAVFTAQLNTYTVRYFDFEGNVILETKVKYGENACFSGTEPKAKENAQFKFQFIGWDNSGEAITKNTDIRPIFERTDKKWNGEISKGFSSGDGSKAAPYLISNGTELAYLSEYVSSGGVTKDKYFSLTENIVLGYGGNNELFSPIGTKEHPFEGSFDGKGYSINGLTVSDVGSAGLFGYAQNAAFSNLILKNSAVSGAISGILCGSLTGNCSVNNCSVQGNSIGKDISGGIIGISLGKGTSIADVSFDGTVSAALCGGIIGSSENTAVKNSLSEVLFSENVTDGICGKADAASEFLSCYYISDKNIGKIGSRISCSDTLNANSYSGFDLLSVWIINTEKAELSISHDNSFKYFVYGDVDVNGVIDMRDMITVAQYIAEWELPLAEDFNLIADVDRDGTVKITDAVMLCQYLAEWEIWLG